MSTVAVVGFIGSGKDTIADYLVNFHNFRRESFAGSLKDAISNIFGWDRTLLEGRTKSAREWREIPDKWWAERLNMPHLTPRWILQNWGTEVCRRGFHSDIWVASVENKLRQNTDDVVISDCRFPNEIAAIKNSGGTVIRVVRGPEPKWFNDAVIMNTSSRNTMEWITASNNFLSYDVHASESAWVGSKFDYVIDNNSTIEDLYKQIEIVIKNLAANRPVST
jgi:hypothetical protein